MKKINLGKTGVELEAYASQGNAILGIRGSGKTYTGTCIAEQLLHFHVPIVALDPIGMWRFLRVPADGGKEAYPVVVAGGQHGDIPLPVRGAGEIMRAALADQVSIVFDLYDVNLSKADWRSIVNDVVKVLLYENKEHGLRHIFIEEAAEFVPQRISPDQGQVYSIIERLVRMGGNAQLGVTLINQRAEEVNKAVLELCDLLLLHRQKGRRSLENLSHWLELAAGTTAKQIAADVPTLKNGECYVWPEGAEAPTKTVIPAKHTFHPDRKDMRTAVIAEARRVDISAFAEQLKGRLAQVIAEAEANDPARLKLLNRTLRHENEQLRAGHADAAPDPEALSAAEARGYNRGWGQALSHFSEVPQMLANIQGGMDAIEFAKDKIGQWFRNAEGAKEFLRPAPPPQVYAKLHAPAPKPVVLVTEWPGVKTRGNGAGDPEVGKSGLRKMLVALAQRPTGLTRRQLGVRAGLSSQTGTFGTYLSKMRTNHWISDESDGRIKITAAGAAALGSYEPLPEGQDLLAYWVRELGESGASRMLQALAGKYPDAVSREELGRLSNLSPETGSFGTYLSRLRTLELITGKGELRASEELFN